MKSRSAMSRRLSQRRAQGGFTIFNVLIATALTATALVAALPLQIEKAEALQAEVSASQIFTLGDVSQQFRVDRGVWPGQATNCALADVNADLIAQGYVTAAFTRSAWGSDLVTTCTPLRFDVSANGPNLVRAQQAAALLHTVVITPNVNADGEAQVTSAFPAGGAPAFGQVLHRVAIPGRPELNQMQTDLDMNGNNILNLGDLAGNDLDFTNGEFDTLTVRQNATLCADDAAGCVVAVNPDGRFTNPNDGNVNFELTNNAGALVITSPGGGGNLTVNGTINAPNQSIMAARGLEWGNGSRLTSSGGSDRIELGGNDTTAGNGTPSMDFHFNGLTEDFNVRFINSANRVMTLNGSGGNLATFIVEGDGIYTNNLQVIGELGTRDVVSSVSNKSLSQAVQTMTIVPAGTNIPVPSYCASFGMVPQIYTSINQVAEGAVATPIYQAATYADLVNPTTWQVHVKLVTESGIYDSGVAGSMSAAATAFNQVLVAVKCERV